MTTAASVLTSSSRPSETPRPRKRSEAELDSEYVLCRDDPVYFVTRHCKTRDARDGLIKKIPDYPYIRELIKALVSGEDVHVEKTRQMIVSWTTMAVDLWGLQFVEGYSSFAASRKETLVDDGGENSTIDSLFGKLRFIHQELPDWLRGSLRFKHLKVEYPKRGSLLVGESSNPNLGRGGSYRRATLDEAARLPHSEQAFSSLRDACPAGIAMVSTPWGRAGLFARIRFEKGMGGFKPLRLHWTKHPLRAKGLYKCEAGCEIHSGGGHPHSPWYDKACQSRTLDQIFRELDINYAGSVAGRCYTEFSYDQHVDASLEYDPNFPLILGFDYGIDNPTAVLFAQYRDPDLFILRDYEASGLIVDDHVEAIQKVLKELGYRGALETLECYGDPAGESRDQAKGHSTVSEYSKLGLYIDSSQSSVRDRVELGKKKFKQGRIWLHPDCDRLVECAENLRWKRDADNEPMEREKRVPNWATHEIDALEYILVGIWPDELKRTGEVDPSQGIVVDEYESLLHKEF